MKMLKTSMTNYQRPQSLDKANNSPIGLIAGGGDLPLKIINASLAKKTPIFVLCIEGQTPNDISIPASVTTIWISMGEIGKALDFLHFNDVKRIVMAGKMSRPSLGDIKPDFKGALWLAKLGMRALGDDGFLRAITELVEKEGFQVISAQDIIDTILAKEGPYTKAIPDDLAMSDIKRGIEVLEALSPVDVGQAVVIQQGIVLGVEAIEGTDQLIERIRHLKLNGSAPVLVKLSKTGQEERVDLPTVGLDTVAGAHKSGICGIAIEAGKTIVLDEEAMLEFADKHGIFIIGIKR